MAHTASEGNGAAEAGGKMTFGVRIVAPHFCAGIEVSQDSRLVKRTAPILSYMRNWDADAVQAYCRSKNWHWSVCKEKPATPAAGHTYETNSGAR